MEYCEYCYDEIVAEAKWDIFVYRTTVDMEYIEPYLKIIKDTYSKIRFAHLGEFWKKKDNLCTLAYFSSSMHYNCVFTLLDSIEQNCLKNKLEYKKNCLKTEKTIEILINYNLN